MYRDQPERVHGRAAVSHQLVLRDPELVALSELAVEQDERLNALLAPVAHRPDRGALHRHSDGGLLADHEVGDAPDVAPVAVRVRKVFDEISPGGDAECPE